MAEPCDYVLPGFLGSIEGITKDNDECLLKAGHKGPHLIRGKNIRYDVVFYEWQPADECSEPEMCEDYLTCQHFTYVRISAAYAQLRLATEGLRT